MSWLVKISILLLLCGTAAATGYVLLTNNSSGDSSSLAGVHNLIERQFAKVNHMDGDRLSNLSREEIVLIDVREISEFSVSHLKGAFQVDPEMPSHAFVEKYSDISKGKTVIFYCSVGQRSSSFADRVQSALLSSGAKAAYNLEGGIFAWHNERRPLFDNSAKPTRYVHPYDPIWGRMVKHQEHTKYQ
ncbi:MAG: rhodanese-like domain-containing protein [Parasphingorhabdus sp.]|uniref:rhodanese-like domain-containing protein n=1 Tax=Alphaproteobacteria TaxID=28211 RepID=UPI003299EA90